MFVNFGYKMYFPGEEHEFKNVDLGTLQSLVENPVRFSILEQLRKKVRENLLKSQESRQNRYNLRRQDVTQ